MQPNGGGRSLLARVRGPRILLYHCFGPAPAAGDPDRQFVRPEQLRRQLRLLRRGGWRPLDLDGFRAVLAGAPAPRRTFLVTIDDGHESVLRLAAPVLAEHGVRAVLFVPPALIGGTMEWAPTYGTEPLLTPRQLKLAAATMDLGVHGLDHTRLTEVPPPELAAHLGRARAEFERLTGEPARAFAYPYGTHDPRVRAEVARAGFDIAFAVAREAGAFGVTRVAVDGGEPLPVFRFKLTVAYRLLAELAGRFPGPRHKARAAVAAARELVGRHAGGDPPH